MGSVVVSVDAELAWGVHDLHPLNEDHARRVAVSRGAWERLADLFEEHAIPATWAFVGHLLVEDGEPYWSDHPLGEAWFETAREGAARDPSLWYGVDLVQAVATARVGHELGSHSFSHPVFTDLPREAADAEFALAREVGRDHGYDLTSFVFPRNEVAHLDALAANGFTCYRGRQPERFGAVPGAEGGALLVGSLTGTVAPPLVTPTIDEYGLVNVPASLFLGGFRDHPWTDLAALDARPGVRLAKLGIDRACDETGVFHLWLHPNDLTSDRYVDRVDAVLAYLAERRDAGDVTVETMGDVAARTLAEAARA